MGHAVYKTTDPRADVLSSLSRIVADQTGTKWFEITERVEKATKKYMLEHHKQPIYPNVDVYSANLETTIWVSQWILIPQYSRFQESQAGALMLLKKSLQSCLKPALYCPMALYVGINRGPMGCEYIPIDNRARS